MTPKFAIGDEVLVAPDHRLGVVKVVHIHESYVKYSISFPSGEYGREGAQECHDEAMLSYTEIEVLRREVARLTAEVNRLKNVSGNLLPFGRFGGQCEAAALEKFGLGVPR